LRGLANANFAELTLDGGAAAFICDFSGTLRRAATARLSCGVSTMEILIPPSTAARVVPEVTLGQLQASDGFQTRDGGYWTAAAVAGKEPVLTIRASTAMGALQLRLSEG
jgi:hypothetical protein